LPWCAVQEGAKPDDKLCDAALAWWRREHPSQQPGGGGFRSAQAARTLLSACAHRLARLHLTVDLRGWQVRSAVRVFVLLKSPGPLRRQVDDSSGPDAWKAAKEFSRELDARRVLHLKQQCVWSWNWAP
jgi:hypothetical protein